MGEGQPPQWFNPGALPADQRAALDANGHPDHDPGPLVTFRPSWSFVKVRAKWLLDLLPLQIPIGELVLVGGRPGTAKSLFAYCLATGVTRGQLPGELRGYPAKVLIMDGENSWEHNIGPRLMVAGAHEGMVGMLELDERSRGDGWELSMVRDLDMVERACVEQRVALIIVDPLISALSPGTNINKAEEVGRELRKLAAMAHRTGITIIGIVHFSKVEGRDPVGQISGSHAFHDVPRAIMVMATDTAGAGLIAQGKNTNGVLMARRSWSYKVWTQRTMLADGEAEIPYLLMGGPSDRDIENIMDTSAQGKDARRARDWIQVAMAERPVWPCDELKRHVQDGAGVSKRTVERVLADVGMGPTYVDGKPHYVRAS
jgi:hypothetical protein